MSWCISVKTTPTVCQYQEVVKNYGILFCHKDVALEAVYKVVLNSRIVRPHSHLVTE
jgi:hypothetical protein